jgi:uncharacterized protein (DUF488 family)
MRRIYAEQLDTDEAALAMEQALAAAAEKKTALLCYEKAAPECHRSMLAERMIARQPFEVVDL